MEIGTLAPIEIIRAEAEVARSQQDLVSAETQVLQQETIIKNALSKTGVSDPRLADARIVPTDSLQDAGHRADSARSGPGGSGLEEPSGTRADAHLSIDNARISLAGDREPVAAHTGRGRIRSQ